MGLGWDAALGATAQQLVDGGVSPSAVVAAARFDGGWRRGCGAAGTLWPASLAPDSPHAEVGTVYDLASLTKPLTALTLARLERAGVVARAEPLADVFGAKLPAIARTASGSVPLDALLAHRAGLVAHNPFYDGLVRGERPDVDSVLLDAADMRRGGLGGPLPPEGFPPVYSDLGYLLVGRALEARTGERLDELVRRQVTTALALGSGDVLGSARQLQEEGVPRARIAPTEVVPWRGGLVHGVVHDENAWLVAGEGTAGHAGLFGTAGAVLALGSLVLDALAGRTEWLSRADLEPLVGPRPGGSLAAGFDRRSEDPAVTPASGARFSPGTFGHLGFTGTSVWVDPRLELVGVLLTNRVCPTREHVAIRAARPRVYDALAQAVLGPG